MKPHEPDCPLFVIEMYTPGEIVEARRSFSAETNEDVLATAKEWINDRRHNAKKTFALLIAMAR
jgi:hypothetical protein